MNDLIAKLRSATAPIHQQLEQAEIAKAMMSPTIDLEKYNNYLKRVLSMHTDVEAIVFPGLHAVITDLNDRKKTAAVKKDLDLINVRGMQDQEISFIDKEYKNQLHFNLGLMYVTEGSVLGGQVILKNIRSVLGSSVPGNFLNVYGEKTGSLWKGFLEQLKTTESNSSEEEKKLLIDGAIYGFTRAIHIFK